MTVVGRVEELAVHEHEAGKTTVTVAAYTRMLRGNHCTILEYSTDTGPAILKSKPKRVGVRGQATQNGTTRRLVMPRLGKRKKQDTMLFRTSL